MNERKMKSNLPPYGKAQAGGWKSLCLIHSRLIDPETIPVNVCPTCGVPLYRLAVGLKDREIIVAYEDDNCRSRDEKRIVNHDHASKARGSCRYVRPGCDIQTGRPLPPALDVPKLRADLEACRSGINDSALPKICRDILAKRAIEIEATLRTVQREAVSPDSDKERAGRGGAK